MSEATVEYLSLEPEKAETLWAHKYGMIEREHDGQKVIDMHDTNFLCFLGRDGQERFVCFGMHCLSLQYALQHAMVPHKLWVSRASMVLIFRREHFARMKESLKEHLGEHERRMTGVRCTRSTVANAIRGYRKRRDEIIREDLAAT